MSQRLYHLPDILVIHIKRFNMTARYREKIRAKVVYPVKNLDMSPYCVKRKSGKTGGGGSGGEGVGRKVLILADKNNGESGDIYDLYGVSNHIGGMNGGHYTAFIRFNSSSDIDFDGVHMVCNITLYLSVIILYRIILYYIVQHHFISYYAI
jgi:ubiquitin carboxyl-terminal hydrolase 4/11